MGTSHRPVSPSARVVDGPVTLAGRNTVPGPIPPRVSLHRCVDQRLGCSIPGIDVEWDVAETRSPHKLVGVTGGAYRTAVTPVSSQREDSSVHDRQLDHSLLSEQARGDKVAGTPQVIDENTEVSLRTTTDHSPETHCGSVERLSGPGLNSGTGGTFGMVPLTTHVPVGDQSVTLGTTTDRHVRKQSKSQVKRIHIPVPGLTSDNSGCAKLSVAIEGDVCISSDVHPATVSVTSEDRKTVQDSPGTAVKPASEVVTHSQQSTKEENDPIPGGTGLATSTTLGSQPPEPRVSKPASGVPGEGRLKSLGFSDNVNKSYWEVQSFVYPQTLQVTVGLIRDVGDGTEVKPVILPLLTNLTMDYLFRVRNVSVRTMMCQRTTQ